MLIRMLLTLLLACSTATVVHSAPLESPRSAARPRGVILLMIDDIGYGDIDILHPSELETPTIDRLYKQSIRLTDFHVGTTCSPSRAALLTGRSVNAGGVWHTIAGREILRENEQTLAEVFQANDWATGVFGKWHLGEGYPFSPRFRGFDVAVIHGGGGVGQGPDHWKNDYYSGVDFKGEPTKADVYMVNGEPVEATEFCTDFWFSQSMKFIDDCLEEQRPFFCYIPTNAAHGPFNAPHGFKAGFDGLIENVDANLLRLEDFLEQRGIRDDTLLIFTTDNGTAGPRLGGLRQRKGSHYDGGHNVPCFWRWKNGGLGGNENDARDVPMLTANMDIMPTLIQMFELDVPEHPLERHGMNLAPWLLNPEQPPRSRRLVVDTQRTARLTHWSRACVMEDVVVDGRIQHKWRLTKANEEAEPQLYDFLVDRDTDEDLAAGNGDVIQALSEHYETWWTRLAPADQAYPPFTVAPSKEKELVLYAHSWIGQDGSPWNQQQIRKAAVGSRTHAIRFSEPGKYRIELRRWPREDDAALGGPSSDGSGKSLPIAQARLTIEGVSVDAQSVSPTDKAAVFQVQVDRPQPTTMTTDFLDADGQLLSGAYYVYITAVK